MSAPARRGAVRVLPRARSRARSTTCTAGAPRARRASPTRSRAPGTAPGETVVLDENVLAGRPRLLRGRRPRDQPRRSASPRTPSTPRAASATSSASATSTTGDRRSTTSCPTCTTASSWANDDRTVFYTRPDDAHAAVAGVAPHARHADRRRRARVPGGRRPLLRVGRAHAHRPPPRGHHRVEDHERGAARRRRRPDRRSRVSSSRASRATSTTSSTTTDPARRPPLRAHERRRRRELQAHGHTARRRPGADVVGDRCSRTAPTSASTTSTRSPATSCVSERADGARAAPRPRPRRRRRDRRRPRHRAARRGVLGVGRREPRVRHDDAALRVHVAGHARRRPTTTTSTTRDVDAREAPAGARATTPTHYETHRLWATARRRHAGPDLGRLARDGDRRADGDRAAAPLRLRLVRDLDRPDVLDRRG